MYTTNACPLHIHSISTPSPLHIHSISTLFFIRICKHVYVYKYTYIYTYVYVYIEIYICIYIHIRIYIGAIYSIPIIPGSLNLSQEYGVFLLKCGALLFEYVASLLECGALWREYRALLRNMGLFCYNIEVCC